MRILYKKDQSGKVRYLKISTKGAELIQESGVLDTDSPITHSKACRGKNIGKTNETTPEQQAVLEMASKVAEKLTEGYFDTLCAAKTEEVILPMLAKSYDDEKDKIDWNEAFVQPKFDGMRCLAFIKNGKVRLMSRQGKEIENMDHIKAELSTIKGEVILDGELYKHGVGFQENMRLIKKYRAGETETMTYCTYDLVSKDSFKDRYTKMAKLVNGMKNILSVKTDLVSDEKKLKLYHQKNLKDLFEGSILRFGNTPYKVGGRSSNLLKYKDFQDIACKIIDITPADSRPTWGVPTLEWKGKTFQAGMKYSHADREDFLTNKKKYIGKTAEIRYFETSEDGIPRFPVMVGIRLDK